MIRSDLIKAIFDVSPQIGTDPLYAGNFRFHGKLTLFDPNMPVENRLQPKDLFGHCSSLSSELQELLVSRGVHTKSSSSSNAHGNGHYFLQTLNTEPQLFIDPTIGQFIKNYPFIYVGTREELKEMVLNAKKGGIVNTKSSRNPQEAFERIWGE